MGITLFLNLFKRYNSVVVDRIATKKKYAWYGICESHFARMLKGVGNKFRLLKRHHNKF